MATHKSLLEAIPERESALIRSNATTVEYRTGFVISDVGDSFDSVQFPLSCVVSITTQMSDGRLVESTTIGREGVVGLPALLGATVSRQHVVVQVPGYSLTVPLKVILDLLPSVEVFASKVGLFADCTMFAMGQSAGCLALHPVAERCARWLLMTADRVDADTFYLTHEYLAAMLGVHRPTVTIAARTLQQAGLIEYRRGTIRILDRAALEDASCECYAAIHLVFEDFLNGAIEA